MSTATQNDDRRRKARAEQRRQEERTRSHVDDVSQNLWPTMDAIRGRGRLTADERLELWAAEIKPETDVELTVLGNAVNLQQELDAAGRAQAARRDRMVEEAADQQELEAMGLGERLFCDPQGPIEIYTTHDYHHVGGRTSYSGIVNDPDHPARLVKKLKATLAGCEWMLERWEALRDLLESGETWQAPDKLKAIRLLGHQPLEAVDVPDVARIFRASYVLDPQRRHAYSELRCELSEEEMLVYTKRIQGRKRERFAKDKPEKARAALLELVDRATAKLQKRLEAHQKVAEAKAARWRDEVAYDISPDGERIRRFQLAATRQVHGTLEQVFGLRHHFIYNEEIRMGMARKRAEAQALRQAQAQAPARAPDSDIEPIDEDDLVAAARDAQVRPDAHTGTADESLDEFLLPALGSNDRSMTEEQRARQILLAKQRAKNQSASTGRGSQARSRSQRKPTESQLLSSATDLLTQILTGEPADKT